MQTILVRSDAWSGRSLPLAAAVMRQLATSDAVFRSSPAISVSNDFWKLSEAIDEQLVGHLSALRSRSPRAPQIVASAASRFASTVRATSPWSRNASMVAGGSVFTVSGPISCSTYITSRYAGFLVLVLAQSGRCTVRALARQRSHRAPENIAR